MKTKNLVLTFAILLCGAFTFAQTEAGHLMIGGNGGFDVQKQDPHNIVTINLNPTIGFFIIDNLPIGATLDFTSIKIGDDYSSSYFGIAPFARYYIGPGGVKLFAHAQFGYITNKDEDDFLGEIKSSGTQLQIGPGLAFFLNDHVSIEALLAYSKRGGDFDGSSFGLNIGVQAYLGGGE